MFENLQERLMGIFQNLKRRGKLTEEDVKLAMREVRMALLEADVNLKVVKDFIKKVRTKAVGEEVMKSLTPAQQVIKIVRDELVELMGSTTASVEMAEKPPTVIMMVGLHGSGKTTSSGKLANHFKRNGLKPMLAATDVYRPAAIRQLEVLGEQLEVPVFQMGDKTSPVNIAKAAVKKASEDGFNPVIIDTAGRLHIDEELMGELQQIKSAVNPNEILLVVDSMVGQDALKMADTYNQEVGITGIVLTKLDGDSRGGAALSARAVTGRPIKFAGVGEKLTALEPFHPDRMVGRILGMGDVLSLIEKAETAIDQEKALELERKIRTSDFTLEDFLEQMDSVQKMGPLEDIMGMLPGMAGNPALKNMQLDTKQMGRVKAIIHSMTPEERANPKMIKGSRRKRIAHGSGVEVADVNRLLKQFKMVKKMMKQVSDMGRSGRGMKGMKLPFPMG